VVAPPASAVNWNEQIVRDRDGRYADQQLRKLKPVPETPTAMVWVQSHSRSLFLRVSTAHQCPSAGSHYAHLQAMLDRRTSPFPQASRSIGRAG
jgi:hypothetical protein